MKLGEIAKKLDFCVIGDNETDISSVRYPKEAASDSVVIGYSRADIESLQAGAFLSKPKIVEGKQNYLICYEGEQYAAVQIAKLLVSQGCYPDYTKPVSYTMTENSVSMGENVNIGNDTVIEPFIVIGNDVCIGRNCRISSGVYIGSGTVIGDNVIVRSGAKIGADALFHTIYEQKYDVFVGVGKVYISDNSEIGCNTVIQRGTFSDTHIGYRTKIGDLVDIGHDVQIGCDCRITSQSGISGNAVIGDRVCILGQAGIAEYIHIGNDSVIMGKSVVTKNIENGSCISGNYGRDNSEELRFQAFLRKLYKERKI